MCWFNGMEINFACWMALGLHNLEIPKEAGSKLTSSADQQCQKRKAAVGLADGSGSLTGLHLHPQTKTSSLRLWEMAIGSSVFVWVVSKKHEHVEAIRIWTLKINAQSEKMSFGVFCPIRAFFCPSFSWKWLVVNQIQLDIFINSRLQFQTKLEIPGSPNYSKPVI